VLGADVVVPQLERLPERELQDLLGPGRERDVSGRSGLALTDDVLDLLADGLQRDPQGLQGLRGDPLTLVDQPEQDVLRADVVVVEHPRLFLGEDHDPAGPVREPLKHALLPPDRRTGPSGLTSRICGPRPTPEAGRAPTAGAFRRAPGAPSGTDYNAGPPNDLPNVSLFKFGARRL
jgi:hypothetical protein